MKATELNKLQVKAVEMFEKAIELLEVSGVNIVIRGNKGYAINGNIISEIRTIDSVQENSRDEYQIHLKDLRGVGLPNSLVVKEDIDSIIVRKSL